MPNKRADRVWDRLIQSYGTRVAESYGHEVPKPWCDAVDNLSDEHIAYGLKHIVSITPVHPPTLGQFIQTCGSMPVATYEVKQTIQEQLADYAMLRMFKGMGNTCIREMGKMRMVGRPWTYVYREWRDDSRKKGLERCAECVGVVIEDDDGGKFGFSVQEMLADPLHAEVLDRLSGRGRKREDQKNWLNMQAKLLADKSNVTAKLEAPK